MQPLFKLMCVLCGLVGFAVSAASVPYDHLIIFGDSLSDCGNTLPSQPSLLIRHGNNTWVKVQGRVGAPITNTDQRTETHPIWDNFLANELVSLKEVDVFPESVAQKRGLKPTEHNVSYAWASAETVDYFTDDATHRTYFPRNTTCVHPGLIKPGDSCVPGLNLQVQYYLSDLKKAGVAVDPQALYFVWAGGNDFFSNLAKALMQYEASVKRLRGWFYFGSKAEAPSVVPPMTHPITNIRRAVSLLVQSGVNPERIYVINLPNLARTPAAIGFTHDHTLLLFALRTMTQYFNWRLRWALHDELFHPHDPLNRVHLVSAYDFLERVATHPKQYQYQHLKTSCFVGGGLPYCRGYLFFNTKHPATQTSQLLAHFMWEQLLADQKR